MNSRTGRPMGRRGSADSSANGEDDRQTLGKFWILVALQALCVMGLVAFVRMGLSTNAFSFIEFWETLMKALGYAVVFVGAQVGFKATARPLLRRCLPLNRRRGSSAEYRVERTAVALFKLSYNVVIFWMWRVLLEKEEKDLGASWPRAIPDFTETGFWIGGRASSVDVDVQAIWSTGTGVSPAMKSFYLLIVGYLTSELLLLLPEWGRVDFLEMLIHHTIAAGLTFFSYMCDFLKIGCLIMYVHNASDVTIYVSRSTIDMPYKLVIGACFILLCFSFLWYRLMVFPFILLRSCWLDSYPYMLEKFGGETSYAYTAWFYFNSTLSVLFTLNAYWWLLILRVGVNFFRSGKARDVGGGVGGTGVLSINSRELVGSPAGDSPESGTSLLRGEGLRARATAKPGARGKSPGSATKSKTSKTTGASPGKVR